MAEQQGSAPWADVRRRIGPPPRGACVAAFRALRRADDDSLALRLLTRLAPDSLSGQARALGTALLWEVEDRARRRKSEKQKDQKIRR
jgi:hypothetical protein